jgi:rod shape-determining protein MreD
MTRRAVAASSPRHDDNFLARLLPVSTMGLATLLSIQPVHIPGYTSLTPFFALMAAYHWTIYRPDLLPPLALFVIGTSQDLLAGAPPGPTALALLLARAIGLRYRHHLENRPFPFVWAGFTGLTAGAMLFLWALHSLLAAEWLDFRGAAFRGVLTISVFPVASFLLGRTQRAFLS